jgi:DNA-binding transcriptional LysR family regulator
MSDLEPSWDHYRTFLAVMREGSLSAAARGLGLAQPTVGRHIDALETAIGIQLFLRTPQGLLPTEAAVDLRPQAEQFAIQATALLRSVSAHRSSAKGAVAGTVRISASDTIAVEVLPDILEALANRYPELIIELSVSDTIEDLLRQEADIAIRMAEPTQEALVVRRIGNIDIGLYAHRRYLEQHGVPTTLDDISRHRVIGYHSESAFVRSMRKRYPVLEHTQAALKVDSNIAQMALIRSGCGIGFFQLGLARRDPNLVRVLQDELAMTLTTFVAMHENLRTTPRCRVTFDAIADGMAAYVKSSDR